jgi:polysaccharide deacetylase family protein (PEP-CTERM system associated)
LNALSFDIEDYFQVSAFNGAIDRADWETMERRVEYNTQKLLSLLNETGTKATFYILGWVAEREQAIDAAGHEIACHGYSHKLIYTQSREEFAEETQRAKAVLEDIVGRPVTSYRAASYSITDASLWALDILFEQGFQTDSSIFPIRHDRYGLRGGPHDPHYLELAGGGKLLEFPLTTAPVGGLQVPASGGGYFRLYPYWLSRLLARRVCDAGRPLMFYLHPWEIDPDQPAVTVNAFTRFRHYNNLEKSASRLSRLLKDFSFTTVGNCLATHYEDLSALPVHSYHR